MKEFNCRPGMGLILGGEIAKTGEFPHMAGKTKIPKNFLTNSNEFQQSDGKMVDAKVDAYLLNVVDL